MSVTDQQPGGEHPAGGDPREALQDRIAADSLTTRRDYLRIVTTVSGGLAVGGIGVAAGILHRHGDGEDGKAPEPKRIAGGLLPGESIAFRYPGEEDRAVAVRLDDGTLVGYSAVCTHLACAVLWRKDRGTEGELYCPCHEGVFDARSGEVTAGPPPRGCPRSWSSSRTTEASGPWGPPGPARASRRASAASSVANAPNSPPVSAARASTAEPSPRPGPPGHAPEPDHR